MANVGSQFYDPRGGYDIITDEVAAPRIAAAEKSLSDPEIYVSSEALKYIGETKQTEPLFKLAAAISSGKSRKDYEREYDLVNKFINPSAAGGNKGTKLKVRTILLLKNLIGTMKGNTDCQTQGRDSRRLRDPRSCASKEFNKSKTDYPTTRVGPRYSVNTLPLRTVGFTEPSLDQLSSIIPWTQEIHEHSVQACDQNLHCLSENLMDIINTKKDVALCRSILDNCRDTRMRDIIRPRDADEPISTHFDLLYLIAQLREIFSVSSFPGMINVHMMSKKTITKPNDTRKEVTKAYKIISVGGPVNEAPWNGATEFTVYDRRGPTTKGVAPYDYRSFDTAAFLAKVSKALLLSLGQAIKNRSAKQCLGIRNTAETILTILNEIKKYESTYVPVFDSDMGLIILAGKDSISDGLKKLPYFKEILEVAKNVVLQEVIATFSSIGPDGKEIKPVPKYTKESILPPPSIAVPVQSPHGKGTWSATRGTGTGRGRGRGRGGAKTTRKIQRKNK